MHMNSTPQLPESLTAIFNRFATSYSSSGMRFSDFPGRWLAFEGKDLEQGVENALLSMEPPRDGVLEAKDRFDAQALAAAGADAEVFIVTLYLAQPSMVVPAAGLAAGPEADAANPMLSISVTSTAQSLGVSGYVELDSQGLPVRVGHVLPLFSVSTESP